MHDTFSSHRGFEPLIRLDWKHEINDSFFYTCNLTNMKYNAMTPGFRNPSQMKYNVVKPGLILSVFFANL